MCASRLALREVGRPTTSLSPSRASCPEDVVGLVHVYHRVVDETDSNIYGTTSTGGQLRFGLPVTRDLNASLFFGAETKTIDDADGANSLVVSDGETFNKAWAGYSLTYNDLDDSKHPTEGLYATLTQQYIGLDHSLLKTEAKARYFMPLMADYGVIGSVKGQAGFIYSFDGPVIRWKRSAVLRALFVVFRAVAWGRRPTPVVA